MITCPVGSNEWTCQLYKNQYSIANWDHDLELPSLGAEDFSVTISGFGSGSSLAMNTGVIYSTKI